MKKITAFLIAIAIPALPLFVSAAGEPLISITFDKPGAKVGEYIEATIRVENFTAAAVIAVPVHFNPDVVQVADWDGAIVQSGKKTPYQIRNESGSAGCLPGRAIGEYFDENGQPLYWYGAILETSIYPKLDNEAGLYTLLFSNDPKDIENETLITIRFRAAKAGYADIRFAADGDGAYEKTLPGGAVYYSGGDTFFPGFSFQELIIGVNETPVEPVRYQAASSADDEPGPTAAVAPPSPQSGTLTYEVPSLLIANMLVRAADETRGYMNIKLEAEAGVTAFIIKVAAEDVIKMYRSFIGWTEFETPIGKIGFDNAVVIDNLTENSEWVICTLTAENTSVTVDGVPLIVKEKTPPKHKDFSDLNNRHWAYTYVMDLVGSGILNGMSDTRFEPESSVTREQFTKMLIMVQGGLNPAAECEFADVSASDWFYPYVASAMNAGIVNGYYGGFFGAGEDITREQMAVMAHRAMPGGQSAIGGDVKFTDSTEISEWAGEAVASMQETGIISGYEDGSFRPKANATRAEAAKIIFTMAKLLK